MKAMKVWWFVAVAGMGLALFPSWVRVAAQAALGTWERPGAVAASDRGR